ncbi:MAG: PilZ domain-containing protein [Deltaproteobacteria bacterium]|nr:PilZ domain-containing protein [Deltaproteobacteria bacterium]
MPKSEGPDRIGTKGRYLPYSGGSLGWFESSGMPASEVPQNYKLYTLFDSAKVRQKLFQRWGKELDRRSETRNNSKKQVGISIQIKKDTFLGVAKDYSMHGMRLQFDKQPPVKLEDDLKVNIHKGNTKDILKTLNAQVVWMTTQGGKKTTYIVGVGFASITDKESKEIQSMFG